MKQYQLHGIGDFIFSVKFIEKKLFLQTTYVICFNFNHWTVYNTEGDVLCPDLSSPILYEELMMFFDIGQGTLWKPSSFF